MKSFQELIEDLKGDPALAETFGKAITARMQAGGEETLTKAFAEIAAEQGYAVRTEEIEELAAAQQETMSEEELSRAAGGTAITLTTIPITVSIIVSVTMDD